MDWLARTPTAVVAAHAEMLDQLLAEESLLAAARVSVGQARRLKPSSVREQWGAWQRLAGRGRRAVKATPGALASAGIKVVNRG